MNPILIVDDHSDYRDFLQTALERFGATGVPVANAAQALDALRNRRFAGLVVDLVMDGMDGLELIRSVRRIDRDVPILLLTGGLHGQTDPFLRAALVMGADLAAGKGGAEIEPIRSLVERARRHDQAA